MNMSAGGRAFSRGVELARTARRLKLLTALATLSLPLASSGLSTQISQFTFEELPAGYATVAETDITSRLPLTSLCACHHRCMAHPGCRSYGHAENTQLCILASVLPQPSNMTEVSQVTAEVRKWFARLAPRYIGEPCGSAEDSCQTPGTTCIEGLCTCRPPRVANEENGCRKTGEFLSIPPSRLNGSRIKSSFRSDSVDDCKQACQEELSCIALMYDHGQSHCTQLAEGIRQDAAGGSSEDLQAFVWRYPRPDGIPPATYTQLSGGRWIGETTMSKLKQGSSLCALTNSILFPVGSQQDADEAVASGLEYDLLGVGLDNMVDMSQYWFSNGTKVDAERLPWASGQQAMSTDAGCVQMRSDGLVREYCETEAGSLCQYVGDNFALLKTSWFNYQAKSGYAVIKANDGNPDNLARTHPTAVNSTWTVDLGQTYIITGFLFSQGTCCQTYQAGLELLVGADPDDFDTQHASMCAHMPEKFTKNLVSRMFSCGLPLTGRYVRLRRPSPAHAGIEIGELAVFGNRLVQT